MARTKGCSSGCLVAVLVMAVAVLVGVGGFWLWHKVQWARADTGDLIGYLADSDAAKRAEAHRRLLDKGDAVVTPLRAALDGGDVGQRTEVVLALLGIGSPEALAAAAHALGDPAMQVAGAAEAGFVRAGKKAEPALIAGLAEAKPAARTTAARLLGETGDKAAAAPLAKALSDRSRAVRVAAANALGALDNAAAAGRLAKALSDKSSAVRVAVANALGSLHSGSAAAGPLAKALSDRSSEVRVAAANAIGALRIKSAANKLVSLFGSPNAQVRKAVIHALEKLGKAAAAGPVSAALWNRSANVRAVAAKECGVMRVKGAAPRLASLLKDGNQRVKWAAENALVKLGAAAVAPLSSQLGTGAGSFKWVAADILVRIARSHPDAVKPLLDLLHHGSVGGVADRYAFFIRLGHRGSEGMLIKALDSYGNATMCVDYLNCGNDKLDRAGRNWAQRHGYSVSTTYGTYSGPTWGSGT